MRQALAKQRGITLIGLAMVLSLVIFVAFIGMKLFPVYSEYYSVTQSMEQVSTQPGISQYSPADVKLALEKRLYIGYVESVSKKQMKVSRSNGYKLRVKYEVRKPLVGNLDFIAKFEKTVDLAG